MSTIFLFIGNCVHSSDLLRTDYIFYLAKKFKVIVFLPEDFNTKIYPVIDNVEYLNLPLIRPSFWYIFRELRMTLNKNNEDYVVIANRMKFNLWHRRLLRAFAWIWPKKLFTNNFFTWLETALSRQEKIFADLIKKYQPKLFLITTPGLKPFEAQAVIQAKKFKIPAVAVNFSWDNLTSNFRHLRATDYLIAWSEVDFNQALELHHYKPEKVFISGAARFDCYFRENPGEVGRNAFLISKGLDPNKKTLLLTSVTKSHPFQKEILRRIIRLRDEGKISGQPNIFFRIHPLDMINNYQEFQGIGNLCLEAAGQEITGLTGKKYIEMSLEDLVNLKQTLKYCDVNINYASTITLEEFVFNKPVVNFTFDDVYGLAYKYDHYAPIVASGAVKVIKTDEELAAAVNNYLTHPEENENERKMIARKYMPFQDGLAYKRSADFLDKILAEANKKNL